MDILTIEGLTRQFGDLTAVERLCLSVEAREVFGLGRNFAILLAATLGLSLVVSRLYANLVR